MQRPTSALRRQLIVLALFGVAFAYVEAAVVVYLREVYEPLALELYPQRDAGELFPLITLDQLQASGNAHLRLLKIELIREAATIVMLAAVGWGVGWNFNTSFAAFVIAFGIWDIFYYVFLKLLIDWPGSLLELDLLFLIPLPWVGPVLSPVLVAICMLVAGTLVLWREGMNRPVRVGWHHWLTMIFGALVIILAFCWDYRQVMAGELPDPFRWPVFLFGLAIGLAGFALALRRSPKLGPKAAD